MDLSIDDIQLDDLLYMLESQRLSKDYRKQINFDECENDIYKLINLFYKSETNVDLGELNSETKDFLYNWLKEKARYSLLNYFMETISYKLVEKIEIDGNIIDDTDWFFVNNYETLFNIMSAQISLDSSDDSEIVDLPKISKSDTYNYVADILTEIDPTLKWLEIYNQIIKEGRLIYLDEYSQEEKDLLAKKLNLDSLDFIKNSCFAIIKDETSNEPYIFLLSTGTLYDVQVILHEFAHYMEKYQSIKAKTKNTILEFFSTFYELYTIDYLSKKGYDEKVISTLKKARTEHTSGLIVDNVNLIVYMYTFLNNLEINEDVDIAYCEQVINSLSDAEKENFLHASDPVKAAHLACDSSIETLILHPLQFNRIYSYIIGDYLANQALKTLEIDKDVLYKIKEYTEIAPYIDPYDVFKIVCDVDELDLKKTALDVEPELLVKIKDFL